MRKRGISDIISNPNLFVDLKYFNISGLSVEFTVLEFDSQLHSSLAEVF